MAYILQTAINGRLQRLIDEVATGLADRTTDTLDQIRVNQGIVAGLRMAMVAVDEGTKELER